MEPGFPKQIVEDFPGVEPEVDVLFLKYLVRGYSFCCGSKT